MYFWNSAVNLFEEAVFLKFRCWTIKGECVFEIPLLTCSRRLHFWNSSVELLQVTVFLKFRCWPVLSGCIFDLFQVVVLLPAAPPPGVWDVGQRSGNIRQKAKIPPGPKIFTIIYQNLFLEWADLHTCCFQQLQNKKSEIRSFLNNKKGPQVYDSVRGAASAHILTQLLLFVPFCYYFYFN